MTRLRNEPAEGEPRESGFWTDASEGRPPSSVGLRIAARIAVIFLLFGVFQFFVVRGITRGQFQDIERINLLDRTRQALLSVAREGKHLESITASTAAWGDAYAYAEKQDSSFIEKAYGGSWPKIYGIDFVTMVAADGHRIWNSEGYPSFELHVPAVFSAERFALSDPYVFPYGSNLKPKDSFVGLVGSKEGVWIYCAHAITDDSMARTPRGVLLFGRLIDKALLASYTFGEGDKLSFVPFDAISPAPLPGYRLMAQEFPLFGRGKTTVHVETGSLVSLTPISGVLNSPVAALRLSVPSTVQRLGERFLWLTSGSLSLMAVITLIFILLAVRVSVIRPIALLAASFQTPAEERDVVLRICAERDDEIGILAAQAEALMIQVKKQNTELETQANTDRLTGLPNRRSFDSHIRNEFRRLIRYRRGSKKTGQMAVAVIDVDHFKLFNDTCGHVAGDACLQAIAASIQSCIFRAGDLACRFGGEEFVLVLPGTDEAGALIVSESVRAAVERIAFPHPTSPVAGVVTVSVGAAATEIMEDFKIEDLVQAADQALYAAKRSGRNRVVGHGAMTETP